MSNEIEIVGDTVYMNIAVNGKMTKRRCVRPRIETRSQLESLRFQESYQPELFDGEELFTAMDGIMTIYSADN